MRNDWISSLNQILPDIRYKLTAVRNLKFVVIGGGVGGQTWWQTPQHWGCIECHFLFLTGGVTALEFSVNSQYLAVAGDKYISVFHNIAGYRSTILELEDRQKSATTAAMRERLQSQIDEARSVVLESVVF